MEQLQLTRVVVAIHDRSTHPTDPGTIEMRLCPGPDGIVFELTEIGNEDGTVQLTEAELEALPRARADLLDQFAAGG
jgi:hypothetical protein